MATPVVVYEILPDEVKVSAFQYLGPNGHGLYVFVNEDGNAEWFARHNDPISGWQLKRGAYYFEFCTSIDPYP